MASYQDKVSFISASPKLPDIASRNVGNYSSGTGTSRKAASTQWIGPLKQRLDYSINYSGTPHADDVEELSREVVKIMISALQPNATKQIWLDLNHVMNVVLPYKDFLHTPSMSHYIERLFLFYNSNMEKLFDVPILDSLHQLFPHDIDRLRSNYGSGMMGTERFVRKMLAQPIIPETTPQREGPEVNPSLALPDGRNPYHLMRRGEEPEKFFKAKPLTFSTLNDNLGHVAMETAANETMWKEAQSSTVAAIKVDLPMMFEHYSEPSTRTPSKESLDFSHLRRSTSPRKKADEFVSMTGRQAVELFLKHKHLHKVKFIYLNKVKSRHYRPYDLISVPREQLDKEHFIFSSFGVLHIYPDESHSETLTLADWNKHAVLWGVLQKVPFFRNYLINKTFNRWVKNVKRLKYNRLRSKISKILLHNVPDFGSSLLHVFRLIHELSEVQFLPKKPNEIVYTIMEFESDNHKLKLEAKDVLGLFFRYCKKVVDTTRQSCFEQLKYFEHQAKHSKPLFCKESLYIQRRKREARARNLQKAQITTRRIPSFVTLCDQAISVHLVALARDAIVQFVEHLLSHADLDDNLTEEETMSTATGSHMTSKDVGSSNRERMEVYSAVFSAKFGFNRQTYHLEMQPSIAKFQAVMQSSVDGILEVMCNQAYSMHSFSALSENKRPGSAPPSVGTSASSEADFSERSLVSSVMSDFDSAKGQEKKDAVQKSGNEVSTSLDQASKRKTIQDASGLTEPFVPPRHLPTKDEDADGIVTPEMMMSSGPDGMLGMMVGGQGLMGNLNPLDQSRLKERMLEDPEIAAAIAKKEEIVNSAIGEISTFCQEQDSWLAEIYKFVSTWNDLEYEKWKGRPARVIEEQLNVIKLWIDKVKNMDRTVITRNKLIYVDCRAPYTLLIPALNTIFRKLIMAAISEASHFALEVTNEAKNALRVLKNKNTDMKSFAEYARKVTVSQGRKNDMTEKVTYIRSLYEVVRMTYRQLTQDEEKLEEKVKSTWEAFLYQLKDATNFVANQRPIIMKQLDTVFQAQYSMAMRVAASASSGTAVDPTAQPNDVINELTGKIAEYHDIHKRLTELSQYRDSVCGEQYDLSDLQGLAESMDNRLNLWKYTSVSKYTITDWKTTVFRKFNVQSALEKIHEWRQVSATFQEQLPAQDPVLNGWNQSLDTMAKELPLLHQLSSEAMKSRHWKDVFTGMGETFEADWTFTVDELLAYKPSQYANTIRRIYKNALAEYSLEQLLRKIKRKWEERQFQLAKHIYVVLESSQEDSDISGSIKTSNIKSQQTKIFQGPGQNPTTQEKDSETFILVGIEDLLREISDSHVTLQGMLQSRHAVEVKGGAEIWSDTLQQIGEIVNLWVSCQDKWMYLTKVFQGDMNLCKKFPHLIPRFNLVDAKYREFISAMAQDPKVLSVMSRLHGQKGWREMQGEVLRRHLTSCIEIEEELLHGISSLLENFRSQFPRLYFLCDEDCIRLLGISRQPKALVPYVRKCFTSVRSVTFSLPKNDGKQSRTAMTSLDQELHSHRLEVTNVVGTYKEVVEIDPLPAHTDATWWLSCLDDKIKKSLSKQLKSLIEFKLQEDVPSATEAINDVYDLEAMADEANPETAQYRHWLLRYPCQVNLLADAVLWFYGLEKHLQLQSGPEEFERIKKETVFQLKQLGQAMQDGMVASTKTSAQKRLQSVVSALIMQTVYHRDILKKLEDNEIKSTKEYEWQSILKYSADIVDYSGVDLKLEEVIEGYPHSTLTKSFVAGDCHINQLSHTTPYGFEYYGIQKSPDHSTGGVGTATVITPTTERCLVNLAVTLQLGQCGGLFGPSNVGKSVVISELARAFGKQYINLSCSDDLTISIIKRNLCGMIQTGSWLCFDHAEHLKQTTLSILSQYIKQIQDAYAALNQSFNTEYTVHGNSDGKALKRSNSVTTLHGHGTACWHPQVTTSFLHILNKMPYEDLDNASHESNDLPSVGSLVFDDKLLPVKSGFGLFMAFTTQPGFQPEIPDSLRSVYRPTCLIKPDELKLIEVWLQASGFVGSINLSQKLFLAFELLQSNAEYISSEAGSIKSDAASIAKLNITTVRSIIALASRLFARLHNQQQRSRTQSVTDSEAGVGYPPSTSSSATSVSRSSRRSELVMASHNEELALVNALLITYKPKLESPQALSHFKDNLKTIFPMITHPMLPKDQDTKLAGAVQQQMVTDGLQPSDEWINKACQLYTLIKLNQSVVIAGAPGSGKTTICRILSKALNNLGTDTFVDVTMLKGKSTSQSGLDFRQKSLKSGVSTSASEFVQSDVFDVPDEDASGYGDLLETDSYGRVDITTIFPNAHTSSELFGFHKPKSHVWKNGLLVKLLKECTVMHKVGPRQKAKDFKRESLQPSAGRKKSANVDLLKSMPSLKKWIVMDGEINPSWVDGISCLLDDHRRAHLNNMDDMSLPTSTNIIFEVASFANASPAVASRCAIVHCSVPENWRNVAASWLDSAYAQYAVTQSTIKVWRELIEDLVPPVLNFLKQTHGSLLNQGLDFFDKNVNEPSPGIHETTSFLSMLSSCLTTHMLTRDRSGHQDVIQDDVTIGKRTQRTSTADDTRSTRTGASGARSRLDDAVPDSHHQLAINLFAFSFVWAFGGSLPENGMLRFDNMVKKTFNKSRHDISFPPYETVFDYFVDEEFGRFSLWEDKIDLRPRALMQDGSQYVPLHQLERYAHISSILLSNKKSVLLVGEAGCGKSSLVRNLLQTELDLSKISVSPGLSASHFQRLIESKALPSSKQHNLGLMAHPNAVIASRSFTDQTALFFLDDLSCACQTNLSSSNQGTKVQPTLELLRQIMSLNGVFELERLLFKSLEADIAFVATATTPGIPGSGLGRISQTMSPRLTRHFTVLNFLKPGRDVILSMYHSSVQSWLEEFPAYSLVRHYDLSQAIIAGAFDLFSTIKSHLKPTPNQPHYVFSFHDIGQIMQGLFLLTPRNRGRPMPIRRRPGGAEQLRRPGGGRQIGRFRSNRGWGDLGTAPMMRTVVRLWLHECSRVFHDRLTSDQDRHWFSRTLHDQLKKHFCTGKEHRPPSPGIEKVRIIKTPVPSGGATPLPSTPHSSGSTDLIPSSSLGGDDTDTFLQSSPETGNLQEGYEADRSTDSESFVSPKLTEVVVKVTEIEEPVVTSTSSESTSTSVNKESDFYETDGTASQVSKNETSTSSNTVKELHVRIPSASSLQDTSFEDAISETTTTQMRNETSTISDDYESRPETALTQDDDAKSTMTGYTTEIETATGSIVSLDDSSESESSTEIATAQQELKQSQQLRFKETETPHPSGLADETDKKPTRPQHGGGPKVSRPGGAKLGVTFVPGLIDDADVDVNAAGPLVNLNQILDENEESTAVLFTHGILSTALGQKRSDTYTESNEEQLSSALKLCLEQYNKSAKFTEERMEMVFFGQAVRHIARLSRALWMKQGGHALLLSSTAFSGRRSIVQLLSYLCNASVFSVAKNGFTTDDTTIHFKEELRKLIKKASFKAGVENSKVILMVEEPFSSNEECLDDICTLIKEGQCPALYSQHELARIAAEIAPGVATKINTSSSSDPSLAASTGRLTVLEKLDQYLDTYFKQIMNNLHVVVLASFPKPQDQTSLTCKDPKNIIFNNNKSLQIFHNTLRRCPDLLTQFACIDLYRAWDHVSWQMVAHHHLQSYAGLCDDDYLSNADTIKIPWSKQSTVSNQVLHVSHLMAHMHQDALERLKAVLHCGAKEMSNPFIFQQMAQLFVGISRMVRSKEIQVIQRYEQALRKVREAEDSTYRYHRDRENLLPKLDDARVTERAWKQHVEEERQEYGEARQRCSIEEDNIEILEQELDRLKSDTNSATNKTSPLYDVALQALESLDENSLDEIKRYKNPPETTIVVVNCLCHMFGVAPANWENGKALINRDRFFQELQFYDKDNIPENIYYMMMTYVQSPEFLPNYIEKGSKAAATLCNWVHAVFQYAETLRLLQPILDAQKSVEAKLEAAQITLGTKRVRCNQIKKELDSKIQMHKNASLAVKHFEKELKNLDTKISKAEILMDNMQEHVDHWRELRSQAASRLEAAVGDSAIVAACVTYFGTLNVKQRDLALKEWTNASINGYLDSGTGDFRISMDVQQPRLIAKTTDTDSYNSKTDTDSLWNDIEDVEGSDDMSDEPTVFLKIRPNLDPTLILSTASEQRVWHRSGLSRDVATRFDALRLHALSLYQDLTWFLIYDPDNEAQKWLNTIHKRVRKDMENIDIVAATPASNQSRPANSSLSQSESLGIIDDRGGESSLSNPANTEDFDSTTETEVTISVSASGTVRSESAKKQHASAQSTKGVRFADESPEVEESSSDDADDTDAELAKELADPSEDEAEQPLFSLDQLWVCKSTDKNLSSCLASAQLHGACLYITHMEQAKIPDTCIFRHLAMKQSVHPNFRVYLGTSLPIQLSTLRAPGLFSVPLYKFAISDMSLNEEGLLEYLEHIVLGQERSEFEAQRRLMEADVFHLEEHLEQLEDNLLSRVAGVSGAILADAGILKALHTYKKDTQITVSSLKETKLMENNLMQKKFDLSFVASHGLRLFDAYQTTAMINPCLYQLSACQFVQLYTECLKSHIRGKSNAGNAASGGTSGSLIRSRVVELKQALTEAIIDLAEKKMFKCDTTIFMTLVALNQMVVTGRMTEEEMKDFIGINEESVPSVFSEVMLNLHKPVWMADELWREVLTLTSRYPNAFGGLAWSVSTRSKHWQEYLSSTPVLLSKVPCNKMHHLTIGQKALLWKVLRPEVLNHVIDDMNASVLGGISTRKNIFDLDQVLDETSQHKPGFFVLPEEAEECCYQPEIHILEKAKARDIICIERSPLFDDDLGDVLEECMIHGRWLLLKNCHLTNEWPEKFLQLLTYMTNNRKRKAEESDEYRPIPTPNIQLSILGSHSTTIKTKSTNTEENESLNSALGLDTEITVEHKAVCHPDFRLWIITCNKCSLAKDIPMQITQNACLFTVESPSSYKDAVRMTHRLLKTLSLSMTDLNPATKSAVEIQTKSFVPYNVRAAVTFPAYVPVGKKNLMLQLSMLHGVLLERVHLGRSSFASPCFWRDTDLVTEMEYVMMARDVEVAKRLISEAVTGQLSEERDVKIAQQLTSQCMVKPEKGTKYKGLAFDIQNLIKNCKTSESGFDVLFQKADLKTVGLHYTASLNTGAKLGHTFSTTLLKICCAKEKQLGNVGGCILTSSALSAETLHIKRTIESYLLQLKETSQPELNKHIFAPTMMEFYASEVVKLKTVIEMVTADLTVCLSIIKGETELTSKFEELTNKIIPDQLPSSWQHDYPQLFKFHRSDSLSQFVTNLDRRVIALHRYMDIATQAIPNITPTPGSNESLHSQSQCSSSTQTVNSYNLAVFTRPDLFLQSVLFTVAKSKFHDPNKYTFRKQFVKRTGSNDSANQPSPPLPFENIFIDGLYLHKATYDKRSGTLQESRSAKLCKMPLLHLTAQKLSNYKRSDNTKEAMFKCPVWLCSDKNPDMFFTSDIITEVPVQTDNQQAQWKTIGTSLLCKLD